MRNQGENPHQLGRVGAGIKTAYAEFTSRMDKTAMVSHRNHSSQDLAVR